MLALLLNVTIVSKDVIDVRNVSKEVTKVRIVNNNFS
jgi:hypothetical protein